MALKLYYRYCVVNSCINNSKNAPQKLFISIPRIPQKRQQWLTLAGQDWTTYAKNSHLHLCEDHFDLPNDMENYVQYKIQGFISKIKLKEGCLPTKFECQPGRKRHASDDCPGTVASASKREREELIEHILNEGNKENLSESGLLQEHRVLQTSAASQQMLEKTEDFQKNIIKENKAIQANICKKYRSKQTQCLTSRTRNTASSPVKMFTRNVSVSTINIKFPSKSGSTKNNTESWSEPTSESDVSLFTPSVKQDNASSSSPPSIQTNRLASDSSLNQEMLNIESDIFKREALKHTKEKIKRRPRYYIGVPEKCYFLVDIIVKQCHIPEEHVLLCLKKIRLNTKFSELGDEFGMSLNNASKVYSKNIQVIAKALQNFIVALDDSTQKALRLNLPIAFRHKYFNVSFIIDCLETEIQKPSKALHQALTWSEYKKANTIKYLISCTPDGLVNYISPGYGGRISDVQLVEDCDFLSKLKPNACILADRGFKHLEQLLSQKGFKLLRPPSVPSGTKLSKEEVRQTKQIASVRIHIERVIRRIREFSMFKPHSVINTNLLGSADEAIRICCALINLQDSIIK